MSRASAPCWVRRPSLLLGTLQPAVIRSILLLNRNLPNDTPWHASSMTTAGRANVLLGDVRQKPWQASSAEAYLAKLRAIFLPHVVDEVSTEVLDGEKAAAYRGATEKPYRSAAFTEKILVRVLDGVETEHTRRVRLLRTISDETHYSLPADLQGRNVPPWVKNPVLLYPDCRGFMVRILKEISHEMEADSDWWRDSFLSTADRVRMVTDRIRRFFDRRVGVPDDKFIPRLPFPGCSEVGVDDVATDAWVASPHKTSSLMGSLFRRHIVVEIKEGAMKFDYTLPGILPKDR